MQIFILGLGLIGGSIAKALKYYTEHTVIGCDMDEETVRRAILVGAVDKISKFNDDYSVISDCDVILLAIYPCGATEFLKKHSVNIRKDALVIDLCGTKRTICDIGFTVAEKYGFNFIGGHPMAGRQVSGFKNANENLFKGASIILVPKSGEQIQKLEKAKKLFTSMGFAEITFSTAQEHDEVIAYTSQLAHILSNAYVKSDTAQRHRGFSAGSFKDMTRVAYLNEEMWTQLFMENKDNLIPEIDTLITALTQYSTAIKSSNSEQLKALLCEGKSKKIQIQ